MIDKLEGRDVINTHKVVHKVNEVIDFLKEEGLMKDDEDNKSKTLTKK